MLNWILNPAHVLILLAAAAVLGPAGAWIWYGRHRCCERECKAAGAIGPLLLVLWFAYNSIEDAFGLDSLLAMGLNALLFLGIGALVAAWVRQKG